MSRSFQIWNILQSRSLECLTVFESGISCNRESPAAGDQVAAREIRRSNKYICPMLRKSGSEAGANRFVVPKPPSTADVVVVPLERTSIDEQIKFFACMKGNLSKISEA